jgi:hypothetical protein
MKADTTSPTGSQYDQAVGADTQSPITDCRHPTPRPPEAIAPPTDNEKVILQ